VANGDPTRSRTAEQRIADLERRLADQEEELRAFFDFFRNNQLAFAGFLGRTGSLHYNRDQHQPPQRQRKRGDR